MLNNHNKRIEDILKQSQRSPQILSMREKQALWTSVQNKIDRENIIMAKEKNSWLSQWQYWLAGALATVACLLWGFIVINNNNNNSRQITKSNSNNMANINVNNETALAFIPLVHNKTMADLFAEMGGGDFEELNLWQFSANKLSEEKSAALPTYNLKTKFTDNQIKKIAEIFNLNSEEFQKNRNNMAQIKSDNPINDLYFDECWMYRNNYFDYEKNQDNMPLDQCVSLSTYEKIDRLNIEQKSEKYPNFTLDEAKNYYAQITGYNINDLVAIETTTNQPIRNLQNLKEYDIYYNKNLLPEKTPFFALPWHVALVNNSIYSLTGSYISDFQSNNNLIAIISEKQAYDRLLAAFQNNLNTQTLQKAGVLLVPDPGLEDKDVKIKISNIILEYRLAITNGDGDNVKLIPVYRVLGYEENSRAKFEIYIDPSEDASLFNDFIL